MKEWNLKDVIDNSVVMFIVMVVVITLNFIILDYCQEKRHAEVMKAIAAAEVK